MKTINAIKIVATYAATVCVSTAFAHDVHGLQDSHWHTTDAWGFVAMGALVVTAIWLSRGSK